MGTKILSILPVALLLSGCAGNSGGGPSKGSAPPHTQPGEQSTCAPDLSRAGTNLEIAVAFNEWQKRCQATEADLEKEIAKVR